MAPVITSPDYISTSPLSSSPPFSIIKFKCYSNQTIMVFIDPHLDKLITYDPPLITKENKFSFSCILSDPDEAKKIYSDPITPNQPIESLIPTTLEKQQPNLEIKIKNEQVNFYDKFDHNFDLSTRKKRGKGFTVIEDQQLCQSWLDISQDAVIGTDQDGGKLWDRVLCSFNDHIKAQSEFRDANALMNRWSIIQRDVTKFAGFLRQMELRNPSGHSYEDIIRDARICFDDSVGRKFAFQHCWVILRNAPKWQKLISKVVSKSDPANKVEKNQNDVDTPVLKPQGITPTSKSEEITAAVDVKPHIGSSASCSSERPQGRKAAKRSLFLDQEQRRRNEISDQVLKTNKRLADAVERQISITETKAEEAIMGKDLSKLSPLQREWYKSEHERIMQKRRRL